MIPYVYSQARFYVTLILKSLFFLSLFFNSYALFAQHNFFECGHEDEQDTTYHTSSGGTLPCYQRDFQCGSDYIPFYKDFNSYDIITVRLNFHFISTGSNNPSFGSTGGNCPSCIGNEEMDANTIAQDIVAELNHRATNLWDYNRREYLTDTTFIWVPYRDKNNVIVSNPYDMRFRFELYDPDNLGFVHFYHLNEHKYKVASGFRDSTCNDGQSVFYIHDSIKVYGNDVLNLAFFDEYYPTEIFNDSILCRTVTGRAGNPVPIGNMWHYWKNQTDTLNPNPPSGSMDLISTYSKLIMHELGHNLSLPHTFASSIPCDADERDLCSNDWDCTTNVMGYNHAQAAFSPGQVDMMLNDAYSKKQPYLEFANNTLHFCVKESGLDELDVHDEVYWDEDDIIVTKDLVIRSGTTLIIEDICVGISKNVRIYVERGAELRIQNATLQTACTSSMAPVNDENIFSRRWGGIKVAGNPNMNHPDDYDDPFTSNDESGRVILLPGTVIRDAGVGISDDWHLPAYDPSRWGGYVYAENVEFRNCFKAVEFMKRGNKISKSKFHTITVDGSGGGVQGKTGISIWATRGIEIEGCTFKNLQNYGVNTINGSFTIGSNNTFENINGVGVEALATNPLFTTSPIEIIGSSTHPNKFRNVPLGIRIGGYGNIINEIEYNDFKSSNINLEHVGIENTGNAILINSNRFENIFNGIGIHNAGFMPNTVSTNQLLNFSTGILYGSGNLSGQFACNVFAQNRFAGVNILQSTFPDQGDPIASNSNLWMRSTNPVTALDIKVFKISIIDDPFLSVFDMSGGNSNMPAFDYYVQNMESAASIHRPLCNLSHSCIGAPGFNQNYQTNNAFANNNCDLPFTPVNPFEEESIFWHNHKIDSLEYVGIDSTNFRVYNKIRASKFTKVVELVNHLISADSIPTAENILENENDFEYKWLDLGLKMHQNDYVASRNILDRLLIDNTNPEIEEFVFVQKENIEWSEDPTYVADSTIQADLRIIAAKPTIPGVTAKALLGFWNDEVFAPYIDYPSDSIVPPLKRGEEDFDQDVSLEQNLLLYPNPGNGLFTLEYQSDKGFENEVEVILYSVNGSSLSSRTFPPTSNNIINLDYRSQPAGIYILTIHSGNTLVHRKIIIQ